MVLCVIPLSQDRRRRWAAPYVYLNTLLDPASYAYVFDQPCRTAGPNAATGKRTLVPSNGLLTSSFSCGHTCCIERKYPVVIVASRCDISMSETGGCVCVKLEVLLRKIWPCFADIHWVQTAVQEENITARKHGLNNAELWCSLEANVAKRWCLT